MVLELVEAMTERIPEGTLGFNLIYIPEPDWMERLVLAMELIEDQMLVDEDLVITLGGVHLKLLGGRSGYLVT